MLRRTKRYNSLKVTTGLVHITYLILYLIPYSSTRCCMRSNDRLLIMTYERMCTYYMASSNLGTRLGGADLLFDWLNDRRHHVKYWREIFGKVRAWMFIGSGHYQLINSFLLSSVFPESSWIRFRYKLNLKTEPLLYLKDV